MSGTLKAVILDLDGVIVDTAEYHYRAWKRLADEEGIAFSRSDNEALRGVSRRESLKIMLADRTVTEDRAQAMMDRKNAYYRDMLRSLTPHDLLPGVAPLLAELRAAGLKVAIASASRNAPEVVERLAIADSLDLLAHGGLVARAKPAPDLFLYTARNLATPAAQCAVIEDAAAGIEAARNVGMVAIGVGPAARVGAADAFFPDLNGITLDQIVQAATWRVAEPVFQAESQHHLEAILTIGNGYLGTRGSFEERYPGDQQATLVHGMYDDRPLVFTELANAPDWTSFEIWVDGIRFSMEQGKISDYARWLDLRTGSLRRRLCWTPPGREHGIELAFHRFADLSDEHLMALQVSVRTLEEPVQVRVRAALDGHVENNSLLHWDYVSQHDCETCADLVVRTRHSRKTLAMSGRLLARAGVVEFSGSDCSGCPGMEARVQLQAGETAVFEKTVAVYTSRDRHNPLVAAQEKAAQAAEQGYEARFRSHAQHWRQYWEQSAVTIEGDAEAQLALSHALFQLRIAAPTTDDGVSIAAKTLSGFGYHGHVFWDNEIFILPFFIYTQPHLARNMLMYRYHTLDGARRKARNNGYLGAQYAWESAETGDEVTPKWLPDFRDPARLVRVWTGDIQLHITADIAYAMYQYWRVSADDEFWREVGVPVLLETALFWGDRVEREGQVFSIRDVIGADEYHEHVDNNALTNAMVRWHLQTALAALDWLRSAAPDQASSLSEQLELTAERLEHWRQVIERIVFLHDPESGLIEQFEGFFELKEVDWARFAGRTESMQAILGIEGANEHQVLKQADVIALLCLLGDQFDEKTWWANWHYYAPRTDHSYGSSLGPAMHAWAACRMGKPEIAYEHFLRAARADLANIRGNAGEGIHAASAGGLWEAVVFGFAGLHLSPEGPQISPRLPAHWRRLAFKVQYRGEWKSFDIRA